MNFRVVCSHGEVTKFITLNKNVGLEENLNLIKLKFNILPSQSIHLIHDKFKILIEEITDLKEDDYLVISLDDQIKSDSNQVPIISIIKNNEKLPAQEKVPDIIFNDNKELISDLLTQTFSDRTQLVKQVKVIISESGFNVFIPR